MRVESDIPMIWTYGYIRER